GRPRAPEREVGLERPVEPAQPEGGRVHDPGKRPAAGDGMSKLPTPAKIGLLVAAVLLALVAGWVLVISPKRSDVSSLKQQIEGTRDQIAAAHGVRTPSQPTIRVADLFRLSRAMPNTADIPGVLLQISRVAEESGVTFQAITPHDPVSLGAYQQIDIDLTFQGRFYDLSDFLYRLRNP